MGSAEQPRLHAGPLVAAVWLPWKDQGHSILDAEFRDDVVVEFDAQAGTSRQRDSAVDQWGKILDQFPHQWRWSEAVLDKVAIGHGGDPVKRCCQIDARAEAVRDWAATVFVAEV